MSLPIPEDNLSTVRLNNRLMTSWLRQCFASPKSLAFLGSTAIAAAAALAVLSGKSLLSASPVDEDAVIRPVAEQMPLIIPKGRHGQATFDAKTVEPPLTRDSVEQQTFGQQTPDASTESGRNSATPPRDNRQPLRLPVLSVAAPAPAPAPTPARAPAPESQNQIQSFPPSGLNFVLAAGISSMPYEPANASTWNQAGHVMRGVPISAVSLGTEPQTPQQPTTQVPGALISSAQQLPPATPVPATPMPIQEPPVTRLPGPDPSIERSNGGSAAHSPSTNFNSAGSEDIPTFPPLPSPPSLSSGQQGWLHVPENSTLQTPFDSTNPSPNSVILQTPDVPPAGSGRIMSQTTVVSGNQSRAYGHSLSAPAPGTSGFRATIEADASRWMNPYSGRTDQMPAGPEQPITPTPSVVLPPDFSAWWDPLVRQQAGIAPRSLPVDVAGLVQQALIYSPQVQVLQADPEVQYRIVRQEEAAFDWRAFLEGKFDDLSDPIGNALTTGDNSTRFDDHRANGAGGVKRRTETGGEVRLAQQLGHQYNNSQFLMPNPQSTTRMELSFRQPLLSQAGTVYNEHQIILARINANSAGDETLKELQTHLLNVAETYWRLYRSRAEFFQRQKLLVSAQNVLTTLEGRNQVDTIPRQILRARAAVARAESRMQRAVTDIRNAESQLRLLVNNPEMLNGGPVEFTPIESPAMMPGTTGLRDSLQTALVNRPDISRAIRQMRASGVRLGVSKNEMLPKLDFIVSTYVAGLQNDLQLGDAFLDQYRHGRPGYTIGLEFEVPLGNRAAKARMEQRQWELTRAINGFKATVETSLTEVEIVNREVETAWRDLLGKYQAMVAAQNEVSYLQDRFDVLPLIEDSSILLLEDLLDGFERLADEESAFAQAQATYAVATIQLREATGTLMRSRFATPEIEPSETEWMTSRVDQAASDAVSRRVKPVSLRSDPSERESSIKPVSVLPTANSEISAPSPRPRTENTSVGGHSFGHSSGR
jgi:outer membrane protein TolC